MDKLSMLSDRGYFVRENAPVYYTDSMDETLAWFEATLGWYGKIFDRDENGAGTYG